MNYLSSKSFSILYILVFCIPLLLSAQQNVGIGTTTPDYPLELVTTGGDGFIHRNGGAVLATYNDGSSCWFGTNTYHDLNFYTNYSAFPSMTIKPNGTVGVNTTTPENFVRFQVNGAAIITESPNDTLQLLIGTKVPNNEAKVLINNVGFPYALKIKGNESTSGNAVYVDGGVIIKGPLRVEGKIEKSSGSFMIDHPLDPENKYLYHSFVESPDMMNVYNGNITTDAQGIATIKLPEYFEALNKDFRYQLTPVGQFAQAMVLEKVTNNSFTIQTDKPNVEISWQITGIRNDAYARTHRLEVEVPKPMEEKGKYMNPSAYGAIK